MKKSLIWAFAALAFAACSNPDMNGNDTPIHGGEIEESYIAINLSASDITRAEDGVYVDGVEAERAVKTAHFFFFKDGMPFPVNITGGAVTSPGGTINHLSATLTGNKENMDNVSDVKDVILLLSSYKGEYPNQIVAVLNWNPEPTKAYYLSELQEAVNLATKYDSADYFVMSNAVYATSDQKVMNATPLTLDNIKKSEDDALAAPVQIYVERVAAKVTVTTADGSTLINLNKPVETLLSGNLTSTDVYAKLLGWELHNDIAQSYLLKHIDPTWTVDNIGFNWNDSAWYRSYWATSLQLPEPTPAEESFKMKYDTVLPGFDTEYGFAIGNSSNVGSDKEMTAKSFTYIGENTNGQDKGTKVILKAQLVDRNENELEIASWYGNKYIGEENLRTAVANTLKYTLYYKESDEKYVGITPEDLQCVAGGTADAPEGVEANEVYFQLSDASEAKDWHKLVNGVFVPVANDLSSDANSVDATNDYLKTIQPGILYKNGETFYYVDIKHIGKPGSLAEYGIVRNHIYNVIIKSIGGYGSPVYIGTSNLVTPEYPDTPDAEETFVSAQINILSWRLVNQEVHIQPGN